MTLDELLRCMPQCPRPRAELLLPHLAHAITEFEIDLSPLRLSAFIAQLAHESGSLRYMQEIASGQAYEGRKDLGNTEHGDGKRYKGRGPIQLTGRANYRRFGKLLGLDLEGHPELAALPENGFRIAGLYWKQRRLNEAADRQDFVLITRRINGGMNGWADRLKHYNLAREVFGLTEWDGKHEV